MSPILVPTLAELRTELDRLDAIRRDLSVKTDAAPTDEAVQAVYDTATDACWRTVDAIADIPAASLADLRVKSYALDWSARLLDGEPYHNPCAGEEKILRQLVAGLLDERIA